jgi:hypothetical protein
MKSNSRKLILSGLFLLLSTSALAGENPQAHIDSYKQQGVTQIDIEKGRELFFSKVGDRSCTSCHGTDLTQKGKHQKTGKVIQPMAMSVNPKRFQRSKKIEKWFLRNCKWTFKRTCTTQEKANILSWLATQ